LHNSARALHPLSSFPTRRSSDLRMLMIGAGQLTEYLATMALFSGFSVTVCDPREEYRGAWQVPGVTLTSEMPDDVVRGFRADRRDRKSTRLNSSHVKISYAVFCL